MAEREELQRVLHLLAKLDADMVTEKLLANEDRFLDDGSLGRDAIDLILLEHELGELPAHGVQKAREAYGPSVDIAWSRALLRLRDHPEKLARFFDVMSIFPEARALVRARLSSLPPRRLPKLS